LILVPIDLKIVETMHILNCLRRFESLKRLGIVQHYLLVQFSQEDLLHEKALSGSLADTISLRRVDGLCPLRARCPLILKHWRLLQVSHLQQRNQLGNIGIVPAASTSEAHALAFSPL
jgi:hypothetical protein